MRSADIWGTKAPVRSSGSQVSNLQSAPRVSIGLPVYNGEKYLRQCLASIEAQSYRDYELIISDNASQDGTAAICQELAARNMRARYVRNPTNIGIMQNFAAVVGHARGELFVWIGCDDVWEPQFLEALVQALDETPDAALAYANYDWIGAAGDFRRAGSVQLAPWMPSMAARFLRFGTAGSRVRNLGLYWWWRNPFMIYGLFRRAALVPLLPFEYLFSHCMHADNILLFRFLCQHGVIADDRVLFHYREKERDLLGPGSSYAALPNSDTWQAPLTSMAEEDVILERVLRAIRETSLPPAERGLLRAALPAISWTRRGWLWARARSRLSS